MRHSEGRFNGSENIELYYQKWLPEGEARGVVMIVHGVGEHSGRYPHVVNGLTAADYAVYAFDQRGHGKSPGTRVHIDRWEQYRGDVAIFDTMVAKDTRGMPRVICGHSMGSLVVLDYLQQLPDGLSGAIISGVATEPAGIAGPALIAMARVMSVVAPKFQINLGLPVTALSRDEAVQKAYADDPLVYPKATARWGAESLKTVERVKAGESDIDVPMLILHGGDDPLNMVAGAETLAREVANPDVTLKIYPGSRHEPHNDLDHEVVVADMVTWLNHLTPALPA